MNANNAREEFLKKYRANLKEIEKTNKVLNINDYLKLEDRMSRSEVDAAITEMTKSMEKLKRNQRKSDTKRRLRISQAEKKNKFKGNIKRTVTALLLTTTALIGGYQAKNLYNEYQQQNSPITLEQSLENGESLSSLGIDNNILLEMQDIEEMLKRDDLTNEEIISLAPRIKKLQSDTLEMKLSKALGVSKDDITYNTNPIEEGMTRETVKTRNNENYHVSKDFLTWENTISSEISNSIKENEEMKEVIQKLRGGDINREEILKKYNEVVKHTDQLAASDVNIDEKGNITVEYTKVADLNKQSDQIKTNTLDQEQNDGEER